MRLRKRLMAAVISLPLAFPMTAVAQPVAVANYRDWSVFTETVDGDTVCYAATAADDLAPKSVEHGEVHFYVSTWKSGAARAQPSLKAGQELRPDLAVTAQVGRQKWTMFSAGREAFALDSDDPALVAALKRGSELRIEAVTTQGDTRVTYHFSLAGSTDAIDKAAAICR